MVKINNKIIDTGVLAVNYESFAKEAGDWRVELMATALNQLIQEREQLAMAVNAKVTSSELTGFGFPYICQRAEDGFNISFPDIPEALTCAKEFSQVHKMATDALLTALEFYLEGGRTIPVSNLTTMYAVDLPVGTKYELFTHNEQIEKGVKRGI